MIWKVARWTLASLAVSLGIVLAGVVGYNLSDDGAGPADTTGGSSLDQRILSEIYKILLEDFVEPGRVTPALLEKGAIAGLIEALGDPHTTYIDPASYKAGIDPITGAFEGIGAQVALDEDSKRIVIIAPFRNSPAERAGIRAGDTILAVNGESTEGWTVAETIARIRGPEGTSITLSVLHENGETADVTITREKIEVPTVFSNLGNSPDLNIVDKEGATVRDIAYIELAQFTEPAVEAMSSALKEARSSGYRGIILDLRRNPGGALSATVDISDMFLDSGLILTQVDRDGKQTTYEAESGGEALDIPLAILVGGGSASGSEVLSAALRDNGRAILIGETTFGKGSVNHLRELSNGGALYVTIARWLTPAGQLIEGAGLEPDFTIEATDSEQTTGIGPQLFAAIDYLHAQFALAHN